MSQPVSKPNPLRNPDFSSLRRECKELVDYLATDDPNSDRAGKIEHYIMEQALEAIYGPGIWDYYNGRIK